MLASDAGHKVPVDYKHRGEIMTRLATVCSLMIASLAMASLATASAHADPPVPAATEATSDPTLRPTTPMPAYPPQSRKKKEAGVVRLMLCVDAAGRATKVDLTQSSGFPNLDNAVLKWAQEIQFNPAMKGSAPVAVCDFPLKYEFQVTKSPTQQSRTTNPFDIGPPGN